MEDYEKKIREEIFTKIKELYKWRKSNENFIPGESKVPYSGRVYDESEMINLVDSALDFWLTAGRYAEQFEMKFANYLGIEHVMLTNSGSSANLLALTSLTSPKLGEKRLKPHDEVITVAAGFPTTTNAIIQNGCIPVFVDVELGTYNINPYLIEEAITPGTKAIMLAHTLGNPFDVDEVMRIVKKYNLFLIEDNCDALGSKFKGKLTGTFGDISTYSFYPPHHITMGEGGALATNDDLLKRLIMSFRDWGRDCWCPPGKDNSCGKRFGWKLGDLPYGYDHKYIYSHIGYNLKITDMQAAIGAAQLKKLPDFILKRKQNFNLIFDSLKKYEDYFILPKTVKGSEPSWFGFPITVRKNQKFDKNRIVNYLESKKIATRMLFAGNIIKQPAYRDVNYRISGDLKNTDIIASDTFWIGVYPGLNDKMLDYMISCFDAFFKKI